jgi:hypothetical protein
MNRMTMPVRRVVAAAKRASAGLVLAGAFAACNPEESGPAVSDEAARDGGAESRVDGSFFDATKIDSTVSDSGSGDVSDAPFCGFTETVCGGTCVDTDVDLANCGACGVSCGSGYVCSRGVCALTCFGGTVECGGACVDPQTSGAHCGATDGCGAGDVGSSGASCSGGTVCNGGSCQVSCPVSQVNCGGTCVDPQTSRAHCGASGACGDGDSGSAGAACTSGTVCNGGSCQVSCPVSQVNCGGTCVDPQTSRAHCGASGACGAGDSGGAGIACSSGNVCNGGTCQVSCPGLQINCGGICVDPQTSRANCGASGACGVGGSGSAGAACASGKVCSAGSCQVSCSLSQVNCGGTCVDPQTSRTHCGASGACGVGASGSAGTACASGKVCNAGTCQLSCPVAQIDCGGMCINPLTDRGYCGASGACGAGGGSAGAVCGAGTVCTGGTCQPSCMSPYIDCGGICADPRNDPQHCNGCSPCPAVPNATVDFCAASTCGIATCAAGFADCNGTVSDGCEVDKLDDDQNCGTCGHVCDVATPICRAGLCVACFGAGPDIRCLRLRNEL